MGANGVVYTLGYEIEEKQMSYKLEASREIADGREVEAALQKEGFEISYADATLDAGATWTATLSTPFRKPRDTSLVFSRSISF